MPRGAWRQHVLEALERREGRAGGLRGLLERHEKLRDRLETLLGGARPGTEHRLEVLELRREREELQRQVAFLTEALERAGAENREQRARIQRLAQDLGVLQHQHQGLQCEAWALSQEAEGLRGELGQAQALLQKAQLERQELEARWVRGKALEAERLNCALQQEEKYQQQVRRLREKLRRARAGTAQTAASEASSSSTTPWEEPEMAAAVGQGQATSTSPSSPVGGVRSHPGSAGADV